MRDRRCRRADADLTELTGTVLICSRQMRRIADDVLHFSKVSLGMFSIRLGPFSPLAMVNSTLRMVETEASQRRIRVAVLVDPSIAVLDADALLADEQRLSQVRHRPLSWPAG